MGTEKICQSEETFQSQSLMHFPAFPSFSAFYRSKPEGIELQPVLKKNIEPNYYFTEKNQRGLGGC
jgi:hypothetical protein